MIFRLFVAFVFLLAFVLAAIDTHAATLIVTKTADTNDGACDADCSLREAVTAAASGDLIVFSPLFDSPQTITLNNGQIAITRDLTIAGPSATTLTISGNNLSRIFFISGCFVVLTGLKLANGRVDSPTDFKGGAIYAIDSSLTLANMIVTNNYARHTSQSSGVIFGSGSGVFSENGNIAVISSVFSENTSAAGSASGPGGGTIASGGATHILNSTVVNNTGNGIVTGGNFPYQLAVIQNTIVSGNSMRGVSCANCTIIGSTVSQNREGGVAAATDSRSVLVIDRSNISNNQSIIGPGRPGGGIYAFGTVTIRNTVIANNVCTGEGGGIFTGARMTIINSAITNNRAFESGGGIYTESRELYLTNSTVSGNVADNGSGNCNCPGGGVYRSSSGSIFLRNSTVTNNRAAGSGGGIFNNVGGTLATGNSLIAGNIANGAIDVSGAVASQGFNLVGNTTGSTGWVSADLQNVNPLLAPLGSNGGSTSTHALMPGGPAINAGNNALVIDPETGFGFSFDQRGPFFDRFVATTVDIGAYEANYSSVPVTVSGRILTDSGRAISNARVTFTDGAGEVSYTQTNPFGYYRFLQLPPGVTFNVTVSHKFYAFGAPVNVTVDRNRDDLNFVGQ